MKMPFKAMHVRRHTSSVWGVDWGSSAIFDGYFTAKSWTLNCNKCVCWFVGSRCWSLAFYNNRKTRHGN